MSHKVMLLNYSNEVLSFVNERRAIRLIIKNKADIVSVWSGERYTSSGATVINLPAVLRMKYFVKRRYSPVPFSRKAVFKRDKYTCCYCAKILHPNNATVDHIIPKCNGGTSSFINCITSCLPCNSKKSHRSIEQAGMILLVKPTAPAKYTYYLSDEDNWHEDWKKYLG